MTDGILALGSLLASEHHYKKTEIHIAATIDSG
jgi:hypothetical protein